MDDLSKVKRDIYIWSGIIPNGFNKKHLKQSLHLVKIQLIKDLEERVKDYEFTIDALDVD